MQASLQPHTASKVRCSKDKNIKHHKTVKHRKLILTVQLYLEAGSLKMNTALEYSTRVVQEGGRRCKKIPRFCSPDPSKNTFNEPAIVLEKLSGVKGSWK